VTGETAGDETPTRESLPELSEDLLELARAVRTALDGWVTRMGATVSAGRAATTVARMATARAIAELRHLAVADAADPAAAPVAEYLRRARTTVTQAAHEIERNRYSLHLMHHQMERLEELARSILPEARPAETEAAAPEAGASEAPEGGADDGGADGEISTG
jgi:hypothetical protein